MKFAMLAITAAIIGMSFLAMPKTQKPGNDISLRQIRTDKIQTSPANDKLARGSWFVEMVLPTSS